VDGDPGRRDLRGAAGAAHVRGGRGAARAWDASNGWAITLTQGILGDGWTLDWPRTNDWVGLPTGQELEVYNAISFGLLVLIAAIGTLWLVRAWRSADGP
jgi:hypothetical protein